MHDSFRALDYTVNIFQFLTVVSNVLVFIFVTWIFHPLESKVPKEV